MSSSTLRVQETNGVVTVTINRPERRNALDPGLIDDLIATMETMAQRTYGVVILTGAGAAFCAGIDLAHIQSLNSKTHAEHHADSERAARLFRTLYDLPLPTIAAVNGHAIAGGMGLATICDFTLAVPEAKFGYTEARIGFVPAIVSIFLTLQIGEKRARDLLLTARLISAEAAAQMGLVNEVIPQLDLMDRANELAHRLLQNSPESLQATKRLLSVSNKARLDRELQLAVESNVSARETADFHEGIAAFLDKRVPHWPSRNS